MTNPVGRLTLRTQSCELGLDLKTGMLSDFRFTSNNLHPWRDILMGEEIYRRKGGIRVTDELTDIEYRDDFGTGWTYYDEARKSHTFAKGTPGGIRGIASKKAGKSTQIRFEKYFKGAPFRMFYTLTADGLEIRWEIAFEIKPGEKPRSLKIEFSFPTMADPMKRSADHRPTWNLWAPVKDAPFPFSCAGGWGHSGASWDIQRFPYGIISNGITVPIVDLYSKEQDVGLAFAAPFELHKPELNFEVDKLYGEVKIIYTNIGLRPTNKPVVAVILHAHEGDWRPALGWLFNKYTEYFVPGDKKIIEQEGPMSYTFPNLTERVVRAWKKDMNFSWAEVLYIPTFGDHVPNAEKWTFDMGIASSQRLPGTIMKLTREKVRAFLKILKKYNVAPFVYFNVCDCEIKLAERCYPESAMVMDNGRKRLGYIWPNGRSRNILLHPDPDSRWGREILRQLEELLVTYPELDGIFFDQLCYRTFDPTRDDGLTMLHNRPCLDTHTLYRKMAERVTSILRKHKKTAFTNGPYNVEIQKGLDGVMSEGRVEGLAQYGYFCLAKPLMILTYRYPLLQFEHTLKACLKYGAFPDVRDHLTNRPRAEITKEEKEIYRRYLPLLETLRGRRWVFHARAIEMPDGYDGNIFKNPRGQYVVTFYPLESLSVDRKNRDISREIKLRLPELGKIKKATWLSVESPKKRQIPIRKTGKDSYKIEVKEYSDASVFVI